jgi:hypothetical protein
MKRHTAVVAALATAIALLASPQVLAAGGKNAYNNPTGDPPADTYQTPYANAGEGRMLIFCAEDETLVTMTLADGSVEVTCIPAAE